MGGEATNFPAMIRATRKRRGWTQEELAEAAGVGRSTIIRWEKGETRPEPQQLRAVANVLGIPLEEAYAATGWWPPEPGDTPSRTLEERKAALLELIDPEDREMLQDLFELIEIRKARRRGNPERSTG